MQKHFGSVFVGVSIVAITGAFSVVHQLEVQSSLSSQRFDYIDEKIAGLKQDVTALREKKEREFIRLEERMNRQDDTIELMMSQLPPNIRKKG